MDPLNERLMAIANGAMRHLPDGAHVWCGVYVTEHYSSIGWYVSGYRGQNEMRAETLDELQRKVTELPTITEEDRTIAAVKKLREDAAKLLAEAEEMEGGAE